MNDDRDIEFITERLEEYCKCAITANMAITLLNKQRAEIEQKDSQLTAVQKLYCNLKNKRFL